jgi:NAD(P)-dependent dehydrogenase (short-subunit alcohol dehydrogenase family)
MRAAVLLVAERRGRGEDASMPETLVVVGVRGLGRIIALHFARLGWQVVCAGRTRATIEAVAAEVQASGGHGMAVVCDLLDRGSLAALVDRPAVDLVVAAQTAGGRFGSKPLIEIADGELVVALDAYVRGTWNLLKTAGPKLLEQRRGTFLQIGTSSGVRTKEGFAALGAAQHGLRALVQVAAREWRSQLVHVAYLPIDAAIESDATAAWIAKMGRERAVPPEEIARACEYLHRQDPRAWTHELPLRPFATEWTAPT